MTSLFNGKCKERMPLGQMTSFKVKIKFDFFGNLIAKTHSNVSFLKNLWTRYIVGLTDEHNDSYKSIKLCLQGLYMSNKCH